MPTCALPSDPSLEHLKSQAKRLQRLAREGSAEALALVRELHPRLPTVAAGDPALATFSRADAQLVVARRYGFPSWNRLRQHLAVVERYSRTPHRQPVGGPLHDDAVRADEFLRLACLTYGGDDPARRAQARALLAAHPGLAGHSLHTAAAVGDVEAAGRLLAADPSAARAEGGPHRWEPLLYAAYSRLDSPDPSHSTLAVAGLLLRHGADPNAGYLWEGLPSPFTALTGAFGGGEGDPPAHRHALALARLLLEAGADANDAQTIYNRSWTRGDAWLELLLEHGLGRGDGGPWRERLGPALSPPAVLVQDALIWSVQHHLAGRVRLLVGSGVVDLDGHGTRHPITGGRSALELALATGQDAIADVLLQAGATPPALDAVEELAAAAMRGDRPAVEALVTADPGVAAELRRREPGLLVHAAEHGRLAAVPLLVELGLDVNAVVQSTALHEAAYRGNVPLVDVLLALGADPRLHDRRFDGTPAGWAFHGGHRALAERLQRAADDAERAAAG